MSDSPSLPAISGPADTQGTQGTAPAHAASQGTAAGRTPAGSQGTGARTPGGGRGGGRGHAPRQPGTPSTLSRPDVDNRARPSIRAPRPDGEQAEPLPRVGAGAGAGQG